VLIGVALVFLDRRFRGLAIASMTATAAFLAWAATSGMLRDAFAVMDSTWLAAVAGKDSLFASDWPAWAWVANLSLLAIAWLAHSARRRHGTSTDEERAILWGATALVVLFLATFPLVLARIALPVQLQISRVFWIVDFVTLMCVIGLARSERAVRTVAALLIGVACVRGVYVMAVEHPERPLFAMHLPATEWEEAARWLKSQPSDIHVLADPGHAWKYGTSIRVAAERDVFLEDVKDSAVAIYSRDVAVRFAERAPLVAGFDQMTAGRTHDLARRYDLDYLVTEADLPLPLAHRNSRFRVYRLGTRD